jgi:hypothetical protein
LIVIENQIGVNVMAKARRGEKTAAVSAYLSSHPDAMPGEIVEALAKQGIKIARTHVSNIKGTLKKAGKVKRKAKPAVAVPVAAVAEKAPMSNGTITLDVVKKVAHTVRKLGGVHQLNELLDVIKEVGGAKKFKDLAEAMAGAETDAIPY